MKAKYGWVAALILGAALALVAGEFWKDKPHTEWTAEEAQKLMSDSPWARRVQVLAGGLLAAQTENPLGGEVELPTPGGQETSSGPQPRAGGRASPDTARFDTYVVQWRSAPIVRQAAARAQQLRGAMTEEQAQQFLAWQLSEYIIAVWGPEMEGFQGLTDSWLQERAYLKTKKRKIAPLRVNLLQNSEKKLQAVEFYFVREVEGEPVIPPREKSVEFSCAARRYSVHARFDLRKMQVGPELIL